MGVYYYDNTEPRQIATDPESNLIALCQRHAQWFLEVRAISFAARPEIDPGCELCQPDLDFVRFDELPVGARFYVVAHGRNPRTIYTKTRRRYMDSSRLDGGSPVNAIGDVLADGRTLSIFFLDHTICDRYIEQEVA